MALERGHEVHPGTVWVWRNTSKLWPLETCSFCGSIKPLTVKRLLDEDNDASSSEWKNNWPHKFYVCSADGKIWKFYSEHLTELSIEEFEAVAESLANVFSIRFEYDAIGRMKFRAPSYGYQFSRLKGESINEPNLDLMYEQELEE